MRLQFDENLWQLSRMDIQLHVTRLMTSCLFEFDHVGANLYSLAKVTITTNNFKIQIGKRRAWCEDLLHTFTTKICTHNKRPGWKWNYYVV